MQEVFIGREKELADLEELYLQERFQLFVLYGRRRVGKTTLLNEFCKFQNHKGTAHHLSTAPWKYPLTVRYGC